jgi:uncharacterized protein YecT (DUF1311 family)
MSACIGLIGDRCADEPGANTMTIVSCQIREQKIWDDYLNAWYGEALKRLKDEPDAAAALKDAQRAWIQYRDAKCDYWEKRYEGAPSPRSRRETACASPRDNAPSRCVSSSTISTISRSAPGRFPLPR